MQNREDIGILIGESAFGDLLAQLQCDITDRTGAVDEEFKLAFDGEGCPGRELVKV